MNIVEEIRQLCREKNAIIMAHYYQRSEIQDVADFVGDSLALAQVAAKTDAEWHLPCHHKLCACISDKIRHNRNDAC